VNLVDGAGVNWMEKKCGPAWLGSRAVLLNMFVRAGPVIVDSTDTRHLEVILDAFLGFTAIRSD
jgi:hypothetical protein